MPLWPRAKSHHLHVNGLLLDALLLLFLWASLWPWLPIRRSSHAVTAPLVSPGHTTHDVGVEDAAVGDADLLEEEEESVEGFGNGAPAVPSPRSARDEGLAKHFVRNNIPESAMRTITHKLRVPKFDRTQVANGFNLFTMMYAPFVVVVSMDGVVVTGRKLPANTALWGAKWVNSSTIVGLLLKWTIYAERIESAQPYLLNWVSGVEELYHFNLPLLHHDIDYNPQSHTFLLLRSCLLAVPQTEGRRATGQHDAILVDEVLEVDRGGAVLWRWRTEDWYPYQASQWTAEGRHPITDCAAYGLRHCKAWTHVTGFYWDVPRGAVYVNVDYLNTVVKVAKASGQVVWAVGDKGNLLLLDKRGNRQSALWSHSSSWKLQSAGPPERLLFFDNDYCNVTRPAKPTGGRAVLRGREVHSRLVEVEVDAATSTAREVWLWQPPLGRYSPWYGDVHRLPGGHTLASFSFISSIQELNANGKPVWEMMFHPRKKMAGPFNQFWVWHVERFFAEPQLEAKSTGREVAVRTWNTVRTRHKAMGSVAIWAEHRQVASQAFLFEANHIDTPLKLSPPLPCGSHLLTVEVRNADGRAGQQRLQHTIPC
eukprot:GGOE01062113.1.p2 GENE.GGOE01062113.1~~GGOE01062113.1.p2  ORF type:complete len:595 (+),score=150.87 GGOE01062113.1:15-1799(+)